MPEFKRTFTGGKMEKDLDERIVPNGLYREALNIEVATSEDSNVGAAENVLGNLQVTEAINGPDFKYIGANRHIAIIADPETDMLYRFVNTEAQTIGVWMDRIIEYDTNAHLKDDYINKETPVMVDIWKVHTICDDTGYDSCNYPFIKVYKNYAQLRPFMSLMIRGGYEAQDIEQVYILKITYGSDNNGDYAVLTLNKDIPDQNNNCSDVDLFFVGDRILNFHPDRKITGINIMDGMIFWTDNHSEPKKVHIKRGKLGCKYFLNPYEPSQFDYKYRHFDQHTRLIINVDEVSGTGQNPTECLKLEVICPIYGCTDPSAINFDPDATLDDGSCIPTIYGCTDDSYGDYPNINGYCRNGTVHTVGQPTCPSYQGNPGGYASVNFDPAANTNQISANNSANPCCIKAGCTDSLYCNYDPNACYDDGTCSGLKGCTDSLSPDYDVNYACDCGGIVNGNDYSCCTYLWDCSEPGYGVEACDGVDTEVVWPIQNTAFPNNDLRQFVEAVVHEFSTVVWSKKSFKDLWWYKYYNPGAFSGNTQAGNYYGTIGSCIFPHTGGQWKKKRHIDKIVISNFLPTNPQYWKQQFDNGVTLSYKLFDNTLHLVDPSETYCQKFLEAYMKPFNANSQVYNLSSASVNINTRTINDPNSTTAPWNNWPNETGYINGFCWNAEQGYGYGYHTYGVQNATGASNDTSFHEKMPSLLGLIRTRGFSNSVMSVNNKHYKTVWVPGLSDWNNINSEWVMDSVFAYIKLKNNPITLSQDYDVYTTAVASGSNPPNTTFQNIIPVGAMPPNIHSDWRMEDIVAVMQGDWEVYGVFAHPFAWTTNYSAVGGSLLVQTNATAMPFDMEIIPTDCICSTWQDCICEKDINGIYATEIECQNDSGNYNTCCSQAFAPVLPSPRLSNPSFTTTYTPPVAPTPAPAPEPVPAPSSGVHQVQRLGQVFGEILPPNGNGAMFGGTVSCDQVSYSTEGNSGACFIGFGTTVTILEQPNFTPATGSLIEAGLCELQVCDTIEDDNGNTYKLLGFQNAGAPDNGILVSVGSNGNSFAVNNSCGGSNNCAANVIFPNYPYPTTCALITTGCNDPNVVSIGGCTDPWALNYYSGVNCDDGSCIYSQ